MPAPGNNARTCNEWNPMEAEVGNRVPGIVGTLRTEDEMLVIIRGFVFAE